MNEVQKFKLTEICNLFMNGKILSLKHVNFPQIDLQFKATPKNNPSRFFMDPQIQIQKEAQRERNRSDVKSGRNETLQEGRGTRTHTGKPHTRKASGSAWNEEDRAFATDTGTTALPHQGQEGRPNQGPRSHKGRMGELNSVRIIICFCKRPHK